MQLEWRPGAREDFAAIVAEIAADKPGAARKFKQEIEARVNALQDFPQLGRASQRPGAEALHELTVHANYLVFYRSNATGLEIVAVVHARRRWP